MHNDLLSVPLCSDEEDVSLAHLEGVAGEGHPLAGLVHLVPDHAVRQPAVLLPLLGGEGETVSGSDNNVSVGFSLRTNIIWKKE